MCCTKSVGSCKLRHLSAAAGLFLYFLAVPGALWSQIDQPIRIGVYDNPPKIFIDTDGTARGFHAELIRAIAQENGWNIEFVDGDWSHMLKMTESGGVDFLVDVAFSTERLRRFAFNEESVFINWAAVYGRRVFLPQSIPELDGKRVAAMADGIHTIGEMGIINLTRDLGVNAEIILVPDYRTAFELVDRGDADVAVVNRIFGSTYADEYHLTRTPIIFNPISIRYAFPRGSERSQYLIQQIDSSLRTLKEDNDSVYYELMDRYLTGYMEHRNVIPLWMVLLLAGISALGVTLAVLTIRLRVEIHHRRAVEVHLRKTRRAAEAADRAKSSFLAHMTHEIRTPMNAIIGYSDLMKDDPALIDKHRRYLEDINSSGEHLLALINEVLDMSRIEAGKTTLEIVDFNLLDTLNQAVLFLRPQADAKGITITTTVDENLPSLLRSDEQKIRQILINLVNNAVKHSGTRVIRIHGERDEVKENRCVVTVQDFGRGVAGKDQQRIFDAFEQSADGTVDGSGLGLAISRGFARSLGGDLTLIDSPEPGTLFQFTFHFEPARDLVQNSPAEERSIVSIDPRFLPVTILIADDRPTNINILAELLSPLGFSLEIVQNGRECLEAFQRRHPDLILMDILMPEMGGIEAVRAIRESTAGASVRIIALTASTDVEDKQRILAAGADFFLYKPYRKHYLLHTIADLLQIQYLYEAQSKSSDASANIAEGAPVGFSPEVTLSRPVLNDLIRAVRLGSQHEINAVLTTCEIDSTVRDSIVRFARDFQFHEILDLLASFTARSEK